MKEAEAAREEEARERQEECAVKDAALERLETELDELREALAAAESAEEVQEQDRGRQQAVCSDQGLQAGSQGVGGKEVRTAGDEQGLPLTLTLDLDFDGRCWRVVEPAVVRAHS